MNAPRLTDAQVSQALRAHLPDRAQAGLRERILETAASTTQQQALPSFLGALGEADPVSRRRSLLIAAAVLVAVALATTAAVGSLGLLDRDPFRNLSIEPPTTLPSPTAAAPSPPVTAAPTAEAADRYQALVARFEADAVGIVAVRGGREERVIASIPLAERRLENLVPSEDGWLAMFYRDGSEFVDLRDLGRAPRSFSMSGTAIGFSWSPDGRFAYWDESGVVTLIDPETGVATTHTVLGPLHDVVGWAADGSALVAYGEGGDGIYAGGERVTDAPWRVIRLDGGPDDAVAPDLYPGLIAFPHYGAAGARLQQCQGTDCPGLPTDAVVGEVPGGSPAAWYRDELAPDAVNDASFAGDGTAMWLLLDRRVGGRQFVLARLDAPGTARVVTASGLPAAGYDPFQILGVAPDDSMIAVAASDLVLVEPISGRATPIDGRFLGFLASATADTWTGEPFRPVEPVASLEPVLPAYPTLPPIDDLVANQLSRGDRELWRQEYVAVEGADGAPSTTEIGPADLKVGLGLVLICSGPSDVLVTMDPDAAFMPLRSGCRSGEAEGGQIPSSVINASARFVVTTSADTSWQIVIFDPAPE